MLVRVGWGVTVLGCLALVALASCGGERDDPGIFGKAGSGGAAAGSGNGGGSVATGGASGFSAGAAGGAVGTGGKADGGGTSGGGTSDGGTSSGGTPSGGTSSGGTSSGGTSSGGTGPTGGTGGSGVGIGPCDGAVCAFVAGDACCVGDGISPHCSNEALGNPCSCKGVTCHDLEIHCDGPEDCDPGKICCASTGFLGSQYDLVECRETCQSEPLSASRREVCHPGGQLCANATQCLADPKLPAGYATCGP